MTGSCRRAEHAFQCQTSFREFWISLWIILQKATGTGLWALS